MLLYQPALDTYHSVFRILQILECNKTLRLEVDRIRILDFYLLFPQELKSFKFKRELFSYRKLGNTASGPYGRVQNSMRVFHQLESLQMSALYSLAGNGFVDSKLLKEEKLVRRTEVSIPDPLTAQIARRSESQGQLVELLALHFAGIPLTAPGGLKDRSGLLEFRHDIA